MTPKRRAIYLSWFFICLCVSKSLLIKMAPYTYTWSRSHFQALPTINTRVFTAARKNMTRRKKQEYTDWEVQILAYAHAPKLRYCAFLCLILSILVPRGRALFGQHQESRPLARCNTGSPRLTDFPSLCACSESSLTNLIGSGLNLLCLQSHSKTECRWTWPEVAILGADQKERGLWGREWILRKSICRIQKFFFLQN